jgi:hypothetical protein
MKNGYRLIDEKTVAMTVSWKDQILECIFDRADLSLVGSADARWRAQPAKAPEGKFYVFAKVPSANGRRMTLGIHQWIMGSNGDMDIHHKDNDGLNNRRENLEFVSHRYNQQQMCTDGKLAYLMARDDHRDETRAHRWAARQTQKETGLTRQAVWKMVTQGSVTENSTYHTYHRYLKLAHEIGIDNLPSAQAEADKRSAKRALRESINGELRMNVTVANMPKEKWHVFVEKLRREGRSVASVLEPVIDRELQTRV